MTQPGSFIQMEIKGDKAVMRELSAAAKLALPTNVVKDIFMKVMKPMLAEAKRNARNVSKNKAQFTKTGRLAKRRTKTGAETSAYKHKGGRHMAKALKLRKMKGNKFPGVNMSVMQRYLPETRTGMRVGHMLERGIERKKGRRRYHSEYPVYRAFKKYERGATKGIERLMLRQMAQHFNKTSYIRFTRSGF